MKRNYVIVLNQTQIDTVSRAVGERQFATSCPDSKDVLMSIVLQKRAQHRSEETTIKIDGVQAELLRDVFQKALSNKLLHHKEAQDFKQLFKDIFSQITPTY